MSGLYIKSIAHYLPSKVLSNRDLEAMVDTTDEWIVTRTGIRERRVSGAGEEVSDMAAKAGEKALAAAGLSARDLDAILLATCTPDMTMPSAASLVQAKLGAPEIMSFDINAACSGFVYAVEVAEGLLSTGRHRNVLLACSEKFSSMVNYRDRSTCILFGDGAGALVLSAEPPGARLVAAYCGGKGELAHLLQRPAGGSRVPFQSHPPEADIYAQMAGREVFKHAVRGMSHSAEQTLALVGWKNSDVDWLVPHQANFRLIESAREKLGLPADRVVLNIERVGNMSAASIPVAMSEAQGRFKPGDRLLCLAFGAGLTWGGLAFEWGAVGSAP